MQQAGYLFISDARRCLYWLFYELCMYHLHYADLRIAQNDVLFVKKEFMRWTIRFAFVKETEDYAKSEDVN